MIATIAPPKIKKNKCEKCGIWSANQGFSGNGWDGQCYNCMCIGQALGASAISFEKIWNRRVKITWEVV